MRTRLRYLLAILLVVLVVFVLYLKDPTDSSPVRVGEGGGPGLEDDRDAPAYGGGVAPVVWNRPNHVRNGHVQGRADENEIPAPVENEIPAPVENKASIKIKQQDTVKVESCIPKVNIALLKAHKTGSSTLQNIFLRYGDENNLNFAIPPNGHHLGYPKYFERKHMIPIDIGVCNIYCHHSRFSTEVLEVMPANTVYVSILRDPVTVFESAFTYFKMDGRAGMPGDPAAMTKFLQRPKYFYNKLPSKVHARNVMLYDFGFPEDDFDDESLMQKAIQMIGKQFDLIIIAEYFEESLILMKELLCFSLEDIAFFKMNSRKEGSVLQLSDSVRKKIISWNKGDIMLYEHFNRTLWTKIKAYGIERMEVEVKKLEEMNQRLFDRCVATDTGGQGDGKYRIFQPPGVKINTFVLKESAKKDVLCERMVKPEIAYTQELRRKQFPNFIKTNRKRPPMNRENPMKKVPKL